jgi:hypothetical protein
MSQQTHRNNVINSLNHSQVWERWRKTITIELVSSDDHMYIPIAEHEYATEEMDKQQGNDVTYD